MIKRWILMEKHRIKARKELAAAKKKMSAAEKKVKKYIQKFQRKIPISKSWFINWRPRRIRSLSTKL